MNKVVDLSTVKVSMERLQVFSIFDLAAQSFMPPFFMPTVGMAVRAFGDDVVRPETHFARHPGDFVLYHLGGFDDLNGKFNLFDDKLIVSRAVDFVPAK